MWFVRNLGEETTYILSRLHFLIIRKYLCYNHESFNLFWITDLKTAAVFESEGLGMRIFLYSINFTLSTFENYFFGEHNWNNVCF